MTAPAPAVPTVRVAARPRRPATGLLPWSPCDDSCLPASGVLPRVGLPCRVWRLAAVGVLVVAGVGIAVGAPLLARLGRMQRVIQVWFLAVLRVLGIRLIATGATRFAPPGTPALVVANHVSWLDVAALQAVQPVRTLAKREIRDWPLVGRLASAGGSIYVDRTRLSTLPRTVAELTAALRAGDPVAVFPEGTTWCGRAFGRYRLATFQAALDAGAMVRPVAIRYRLADGTPTTAAAYIGTATLLSSVRRVAALDGLVIELTVLPSLSPDDHPDRRNMAAAAQHATSATG